MRGRAFLIAVVIGAAALGHWTGDGARPQLAQTNGSSSSGGGTNTSGDSGTSGGNTTSDGSSSSNNNDGSSGTSNGSSSSGKGTGESNGDGTGGTTPGGGTTRATTPGGGTVATTPGPATTIAPERVRPAKSTECPDDVGEGVRCYRIRPKGNTGGARLPDGRVVVLPPGPNVNVDTGASTSNDIDQVIVVNNDNRVINREAVGRRVGQWIAATIGLLVLVLAAAGVGAYIFRAGMRQGREQGGAGGDGDAK